MTDNSNYFQYASDTTPKEFICPILGVVMTEPMISTGTGISFERVAIVQWQSLRGNMCPITGGNLGELKPNNGLRMKISLWQHHTGYRRVQLANNNTNHDININNASNVSSVRALASSNNGPSSSQSQKTVDPEKFEKVTKLLETITAYNVKADMDRLNNDQEKKSSLQQVELSNSPYYCPSIFRRGPTFYTTSRSS